MNSIKNIFITILVLTGTMVTPKTYSKTIFLKSDFDLKKCHLSSQKNLDKVNSKFLNYTNIFFTNYTELNINKSRITARFSPKNNLGQKIELKQLASDLGYKRLAWVNYVTHDREIVKSDLEEIRFAGRELIQNSNCALSIGTIEDRDILEVSVAEKNSIIPENKEIELIAKTIWGEGRGESYEGKVAIGNVIINRYKVSQATKKSDWWGNTIEQIILHPYQFSCHNHNDPNKTKIAKLTTEDYHYRESLKIARGILSGAIKDNTLGATHYFAYKTVQPRWASKMKRTKRIGNHDFYKN